MNKLVLFILLVTSFVTQAQNRYMLFFSDKAGSLYSINNPLEYLSQRAVDRRANEGVSITEEDLPVNESYLEVIRNLGASILYPTKWMNGVLVECDESLVSTLEDQAFVTHVEYVAPGVRPSGRVSQNSRVKNLKFKNSSAGGTASTNVQLSMIGLDQMHANGYKGEGVLIAILDAGFPSVNTNPYFQQIINDKRISSASYDFVTGSDNVFHLNSHGAHVFSIIGAYKTGEYVGGAYKADFALFITEYEPSELKVEEYNWLFAAERADSLGVDIITTSLGYSNYFDDLAMNYMQSQMDGETAVVTRASTMAAERGIVVIASAGNEGNNSWQTITAPADGKKVLAVGAITSSGSKSSFSSIGPTADGRIKPDVVALGSGVSLISPAGTVITGSGTSYAAPLVASLAALVKQRFENMKSSEILDTIRKISDKFLQPDNQLGYGIPNPLSFITSTEDSNDEQFTIFPNPFTDEVNISSSLNLSGSTKVAITDALGQEVNFSRVPIISKEVITVKLEDKAPGLYFLKIQNGSNLYTYKILRVD